jgi:hypothetical protein
MKQTFGRSRPVNWAMNRSTGDGVSSIKKPPPPIARMRGAIA